MSPYYQKNWTQVTQVRLGLVLYQGDSVHPLSQNVVAVPLAAFFGV